MNKVNKEFDVFEFLNKYSNVIIIVLLIFTLFKSCNNNSTKILKKIENTSSRIDSLKTYIEIEGLKSEKRMIQSTDRKILDVNRQTAIDEELKKLENNK